MKMQYDPPSRHIGMGARLVRPEGLMPYINIQINTSEMAQLVAEALISSAEDYMKLDYYSDAEACLMVANQLRPMADILEAEESEV